MDWDRVLGIYRDLAEALGEQLYVVVMCRDDSFIHSICCILR